MISIFPEDIVITKTVYADNHTLRQNITGQMKVTKRELDQNLKKRLMLHQKIPYNKRGRKG